MINVKKMTFNVFSIQDENKGPYRLVEINFGPEEAFDESYYDDSEPLQIAIGLMIEILEAKGIKDQVDSVERNLIRYIDGSYSAVVFYEKIKEFFEELEEETR